MEPATDTTGTSSQSSTRLRLRRLWLQTHRWLGLSVGVLFVLLGLTGSLLVFDHAIDEWLNPALLLSERTGSRCSIDEIITAAEQGFGDGTARAASVSTPRVENGVWTVWFTDESSGEVRYVAVHVDPYTGEVTGQRVWGEYLMTWLYRLHYNLLADTAGSIIVGVAGILFLFSVGSGIYLWWPLWKRSWRAALAVRGGRRFNYDLHKTVGIVSAAVLLVICFTGVYMEFPMVFHDVVSTFAEESEYPEDLESKPGGTNASISAEKAIAIAQRLYPEARFDHLHPPEGESGVFEVALRQPGEVQQSYGRTQVFIDRYSGEVVTVYTPADFTAADVFFAWQFPMHNGEAFGLVGRWIVFLIGLTPALLYVTGFLVWWKRGASNKRSSRTADRDAARNDGDRIAIGGPQLAEATDNARIPELDGALP